MTDITLTGLSILQLVKLGDAALKSGDATLARGIYAKALSVTKPQFRSPIKVRLGLLAVLNKRVPAVAEVLAAIEEIDKFHAFVGEGLATWLKTLPFFDDPRFEALFEKHAALLPLSNWQWNLSTVLWAVSQTKSLPGDLVELGVFKGHTTLFVAEYVDFATWPKRWRLYDTFEGIPEDQVDPGWEAINAGLYTDKFSHEEVVGRFAHIPNIEVVKGRVPEVLAEGLPERISFLHMDLNNVTAEIAALEIIFDRIVSGGIIVFDDYGWTVSHAQHDAEKAWMAAQGYEILAVPTGQGVVVKR